MGHQFAHDAVVKEALSIIDDTCYRVVHELLTEKIE